MKIKGINSVFLMAMLLTGGIASAQVVVKGNVYGGGELGIVETNTTVTIKTGSTTKGSVYGGGQGDISDENAGSVKGNTLVNMTGGRVESSLYGGGELGSVGTFTGFRTVNYTEGPNFGQSVDVPTKCASGTGIAKVLISGGQVGLNATKMPYGDDPGSDVIGYVFCGGQGEVDSITLGNHKAIAMAVVDSTHIEISDSALITASVYGGCENGLVLRNTHVIIAGGQIGTGHYKDQGVDKWDRAYDQAALAAVIAKIKAGTYTDSDAAGYHECDAFPFESPYDVYDYYGNDPSNQQATGSSATNPTNGQTFFGKVFGGGSGYYPAAPGIWRRAAGQVIGNTLVEITDGLILSAVYGGNEYTDVLGKSTVEMSGGIVGVPRTLNGIRNHPISCSLFGAGMGDPRLWANTWTTVNEAEVNITGGTIFGSVFGGGEDGHVNGDVNVTIEGNNTLIGTFGTSNYDGNVFGSGRGLYGIALTAGNTGGNVYLNIAGGKVLGSVYGGGRLGSVGYELALATVNGQPNPKYGHMQGGNDHGIVTVNVTGGEIGNNVFAGSMGRLKSLDGNTVNSNWPNLARVKKGILNISGTGTVIKGKVYGGSEYGTVSDSTRVTVTGGLLSQDVFGGGYGSNDHTISGNFKNADGTSAVTTTPVTAIGWAGRVEGNTKVNIAGGTVSGSVYGGGELASLGKLNATTGQPVLADNAGIAQVNVTGGTIGSNTVYVTDKPDNDEVGHVFGAGKGLASESQTAYKNLCNVNHTKLSVSGGTIYGSVYGGSADGHVLGNDSVFISTGANIGTYGTSGLDGSVFGGGKGSGYFTHTSLTDSTFHMYKTCGRVAGNTYVNMNGGTLLGCIYGGGRLALTGVDVDGEPRFPGITTQYDSINHGLARIEVDGDSFIGNFDPDSILQCFYSLGDIFGGGLGDLSYYDDALAGRVANAIVSLKGNTRIYCSVFGGGEIAGIGYCDASGNFLTGTGTSRDTIGGSTIIGIDEEFDYSYSTQHSTQPSVWTMFDTVNYVRMLSHTCTGNVFGAGQGDASPNYRNWINLSRSRSAEVVVKDSPTIMSSVFGGSEQGTVTENTYVKIMGGTIGKTGLVADSLNPNNPSQVINTSLYSFGNVFGGGFGVDSLQTGANNNALLLFPNAIAGRVYGDTYVTVSGGTIRGNVYGGGNMASVGTDNNGTLTHGKCNVTVSGGTIGPLDNAELSGNVFGACKGLFGEPNKKYCNVNNTEVTVSGGAIAGSVYGGSAYGHVLANTKVNVNTGANIGTDGYHRFDGHVFGGGKGYDLLVKNNSGQTTHYFTTHGRVGGNTDVQMNGGLVKGCVYGGGLLASIGVDEDGKVVDATGPVFKDPDDDTRYDSIRHGLTKVLISGGTVGNVGTDNGLSLLWSKHRIGNVYGGGRGDINQFREDDYARTANAKVTVNGSPTIYGSVYGGGQMANVGYWLGYDDGWYVNGTAATHVIVEGSPTIGTLLEFKDEPGADYSHHPAQWTLFDTIYYVDYEVDPYDTTYLRLLTHTRTGNVYGGGQGDVQIDDNGFVVGLEQGHCRETFVEISETPVIMSSVFGGSEEGAVWGETNVHISGGTIGRNDLVADSLTAANGWQAATNSYSYGNVFGGSYGQDSYKHMDVTKLANLERGVDSINGLSGRVYGNTLVEITGGTIRGNVFGGGDLASVGLWNKTLDSEGHLIDIVAINDPDRPKYRGNATVTISGNSTVIGPFDGTKMNGFVFGGGKGFYDDPNELRKAFANVDSTFVTINGGTIGGSVVGGGSDSHVLGSTSVIVHAGTIGKDGLSTADGNIVGGGRNFLNSNPTNGRVVGNIGVTMDGGTIQGSIFGGGRMARSGVNLKGEFPESNWEVAKHGNVTVNISGNTTSIGNINGDQLLKGSEESVGDVFGSGKGDTKEYEDVLAGCVSNTEINITGSPRIYGGVFGGGEMASVGYLDSNDDFIEGTGETKVVVGSTNPSESANLIIGTYREYSKEYMQNPGHWTIYDDDTNRNRLVHTCAGNVYGGCQGDVDTLSPNWIIMARSDTATVIINSGHILSSVFGGPEQGTMRSGASVTINGGEIGQTGLTAADNTTYSFGGVYGGGYGSDNLVAHENAMPLTSGGYELAANIAGRVYGNTKVEINGGRIRENVFGGGEMASVTGDCEVIVNKVTEIGPLDRLGMDSLNMAGNVYGGGKGIASDAYKKYCNVNNTKVTIGNGSDQANIKGDVYGGGADCHVLGNTEVYIHACANIGTDGVTNFDGNVFGGGRGSGYYYKNSPTATDSTFILNQTCGRVEGNTNITMDGGSLKSSIFGGGRLALTGVKEDGGYNNDANKGKATIRVSAGTIGTSDSESLLLCDYSVGDIFGSGKGDIVNYEAIMAGCVTNTDIKITGSPTIQGSVFGGGEMAGIGYRNNGVFIDGTGVSTIVIGEGASDNPVIGTEDEFTYYTDPALHGATANPGQWTIYGDDHKILHTCTGNVYGGSQGDVDTTAAAWVSMASSKTSTVTINKGTIKGKVYGGSEQGTVIGNTLVTINGGTIGTTIGTGSNAYYFGDVYGGGYGSDDDDDNNSTATNDSTLTLGLLASPEFIAGRVYGKSQVDFNGGKVVGSVFGGGEMAYIGYANTNTGKSEVNIDFAHSTTDTIYGHVYGANNINGGPYGDAKVNVTKGDLHNVFGGGNVADCPGTTEVILNPVALADITIDTLFGGGNLASTGGSTITMNDGTVLYGVYGGCNAYDSVNGNIVVNIKSGVVGTSNTQRANVHGGGYGQNTGSTGDITVTIGDLSNTRTSTPPRLWGDLYGGSALGSVNDDGNDVTTVNLINGTLNGDLYGGGLGDSINTAHGYNGQANIAALSHGKIVVNVGMVKPGTTDTIGEAVITGKVYGCNNLNGTPKDDVNVNIYKTAHGIDAAHNLYPSGLVWTNPNVLANNTAEQTYAIKAVYGGGNKASYIPDVANKSTTVHVYTCVNTIEEVYGGGNAAHVGSSAVTTNTNLIVDGGRIYRSFGGGNGSTLDMSNNYLPADIHGKSSSYINGGVINEVFGGSNTTGTIDNTYLAVDSTGCDEYFGSIFGGGNNAIIYGDGELTITCGAGNFEEVYGGSNLADIGSPTNPSNVTLNIQGGHIQKVFGGSKGSLEIPAVGEVGQPGYVPAVPARPANIYGNVTLNLQGGRIHNAFGGSNINGNITGIITVNVIDTIVNECPLLVDTIYGASNATPYTPDSVLVGGRKVTPISPVVNVMHVEGNSINGCVFGGGMGHEAVVTANPKVTIGGSTSPNHTAIIEHNVYGGGNAAKVIGNTHVILDGSSKVDIKGDVFGAGHGADVEGNAKVEIKQATTTPTPQP